MERRVAVEGCHNFRDLGGYPTETGGALRWRLLFRADGLHALSAARRRDRARRDRARRHHRPALERRARARRARPARARGDPLPPPAAVRRRARGQQAPPLGASLADLYFGMIDFARGPIAKVVTVLARTDAIPRCSTARRARTAPA